MREENRENKLYAEWLETPHAERQDVDARLSTAVKRHAQAVVWKKLNQAETDLVQAITIAVMTQLRQFRQECRFSTWVHEIAERKVKEDLRKKIRARNVFDEYTSVVENDGDNALDKRVGEVTPSAIPQFDGEIAVREFIESLPEKDGQLLRYKREGLKSKEIAEAMGTTVEAVDSRWARLKPRVKKIRSSRRK